MIAIQVVVLLMVAVWGAVLLLRGSLLAGSTILLFCAACLGPHITSVDLGPARMSVDRLMFFSLIPAYFIHRCTGKTDPKPLQSSDWLLFLFLICLTISTFTHDFRRSYGGTNLAPPFWKLLGGFLMPAVIFWVARQARLDGRKLARVELWFVLLGAYLAVTGILEITKQWWLVFPRQIADPNMGIHFGRARGPMLSSVPYGVYLSTCLLMSWAFWHRCGRTMRVLQCVVGLPIFLAAIYFSYTRSIWAGLVVAFLIAATMALQGRVRAVVITGALSAGVLFWLVCSDSVVNLEREYSGEMSAESAASRQSFAYVSWLMFKDKPLFGHGFGQFPAEKVPYLSDRATALDLEKIRMRPHHIVLLCLLTEVGIVGATLFLALLSAWGAHAYHVWRNPAAPDWARRLAIVFAATLGLYFVQCLFHDFTAKPEINYLIFFLAGLMTSVRCSLEPSRPPVSVAGNTSLYFPDVVSATAT